MRKTSWIVLMSGLVYSLVLIGCGDDDCPSCPADVDTVTVQTAMMIANVTLYGDDIGLFGSIYGLDGYAPEVDSVTLGDRSFEITERDVQDGAGSFLTCGSLHDAGGLSSGDRVDVFIHTPTGACSANVKVLDSQTDCPQIIDWSIFPPYDTVDIGSEIIVAWPPVAEADWYYVYWYQKYDTTGYYRYRSDEYITDDTALTIPAALVNADGWFRFYISANSGPSIDDRTGNIEGGVVKGIIYGSAGWGIYIHVGEGAPMPGAGDSGMLKTGIIPLAESFRSIRAGK